MKISYLGVDGGRCGQVFFFFFFELWGENLSSRCQVIERLLHEHNFATWWCVAPSCLKIWIPAVFLGRAYTVSIRVCRCHDSDKRDNQLLYRMTSSEYIRPNIHALCLWVSMGYSRHCMKFPWLRMWHSMVRSQKSWQDWAMWHVNFYARFHAKKW